MSTQPRLYRRRPADVYGGSMKKHTPGFNLYCSIIPNASVSWNSNLFLNEYMALILLHRVSGYQRDPIPRPDSPRFISPDPDASIPPWLALFLTIVRNAFSFSVPGTRSSTSVTVSMSNLNPRILPISHMQSSERIVFHTDATSESSSDMTALVARFSITADRLTDPPPRNGSTRIP